MLKNTQNKSKIMKLLIINPHPDDAEFTCACTIKQALDLGWDVYEVLMTSDEYGTSRNDFKGKRIRRIRKHEMREAAKAYGTKLDGKPKINLIWFGEIDGYLPFNKRVFLKLKTLILNLKPHVVIAPDSFFSLDLHPDHLHTGWLVYVAIKSMKPFQRPLLLLYHSFNPNFYITIKDLSIQMEALSKHASQISPLGLKYLKLIRGIYYYSRMIHTAPYLAEGFRKVEFKPNENSIKKIKHELIYCYIVKHMSGPPREHYLPTPKELGLIP
ncbi:MAG: PIG-L deacetylase family protein [Promethearchaeota archaeon]